ncbi:polysaccharide deacetylase family protein [Azospirillum sp.]|uniref:polysaccharide deacetylase family protein n=1 Tax=Azospirillum sp. TaxID=34012 RepID=UPI0026049F40|nr:polysaccharide deacetylase family protein [Azospirillum sp.]
MKAIMYHYVRPDDPARPFFRHLHLDDFRSQLDWLGKNYGFVEKSEFLAVTGGASVPRNGVILTFDDGLADHHRYVLPELEARGLWGIFYVPTGFYRTGRMLDVHRVHQLLGCHGGVFMSEALQEIIEPSMLAHAHVEEFRSTTYLHQSNDEATTAFKRTLNYFVDAKYRDGVLDALENNFSSCSQSSQELYMSKKEVKDIYDRGMIIGSHSVNHRVMSLLTPDEQALEIDDSFAILEKVIGAELSPRSFCYPYGGFHTFTAATEQLLAMAGCRFSFNVEPRDINVSDVAERPQALPRYDCNMFPFGQCRPHSAPPN